MFQNCRLQGLQRDTPVIGHIAHILQSQLAALQDVIQGPRGALQREPEIRVMSKSQPTEVQSDIPALSHAGLIQEPASPANTAFRASRYPVPAQPPNTPRYLHPAPITNPHPLAVLNCPKIPSSLHGEVLRITSPRKPASCWVLCSILH